MSYILRGLDFVGYQGVVQLGSQWYLIAMDNSWEPQRLDNREIFRWSRNVLIESQEVMFSSLEEAITHIRDECLLHTEQPSITIEDVQSFLSNGFTYIAEQGIDIEFPNPDVAGSSARTNSKKVQLILLLEELHDRTRCSYETMRKAIEQEMQPGIYTDDMFRNKFRDREGSRSTYEVSELTGVVRALTKDIDETRRCSAEEAINLFAFAGLVQDTRGALAGIFPKPEFEAAWARFHHVSPSEPEPMPTMHLPEFPQLFIGRENDMQWIGRRLGLAAGPDQRLLTVVRGWPGVGKTTFVNHLANNHEIQAVFPDGVMWASVGTRGNLFDTLRKWGRKLGNFRIQDAKTIADVTEELRQTFSNKKILLVADDIWELADGQTFKQLMTPRVTLILTTRFTALATTLAEIPSNVYLLPVLTAENSLELFRVVAPNASKKYHNKLTQLAKTLEGLPLALRVAGRLIEDAEGLGLDVLDLIDQLNSQYSLISHQAPSDRMNETTGTTQPIRTIFQSSIDTMSSEAQDAFAYLGAFAPKPATFSLSAMQSVWDVKVEDAIELTQILVGRGLLESLGEGRFQMHYTLSMYARSLLEDENASIDG